jgi:hypothetical protein
MNKFIEALKFYELYYRHELMQKLNKKRNPIAKQLRHYKNKIIKNKRLYDRKKQQQMLQHSQAI